MISLLMLSGLRADPLLMLAVLIGVSAGVIVAGGIVLLVIDLVRRRR